MSLHKQAGRWEGGKKLFSLRRLPAHHDTVCSPLQQTGQAEASEVVRCLPGKIRIIPTWRFCRNLPLASCLEFCFLTSQMTRCGSCILVYFVLRGLDFYPAPQLWVFGINLSIILKSAGH